MPTPQIQSSSYQTGQIIGQILFVTLPFAFGYVLYKYIMTKEKRFKVLSWIIGIPTAAFVLLFILGAINVLMDISSRKKSILPQTSESIQDVMNEKWGLVEGDRWKYGLSLPNMKYWNIQKGKGAIDLVMQYRELTIQIIPEYLELPSKKKMLDLVMKSIYENSNIKNINLKEQYTAVIDKEEWIVQDADMTVNDVAVSYRWYVYTGFGKSVQLIFNAPNEQFKIQEKLIDKIAKTYYIGR